MTTLPRYWCPNDEFSALIAPPSDIPLTLEVVGTIRFVPLSDTNTSNFLTTYLSDLYVAASMIWFSMYQRDDAMQAKWEAIYQGLLGSAVVEEARKKFADMYPRASKPTSLTDQAAAPTVA